MSKLWLLVQEHNTMQEGGKKKCHIVDNNGNCLCGRKVGLDKSTFGSITQEVDYNYLITNPVSSLMEEICIKCLNKAVDIIDKDVNKELTISQNSINYKELH